MISDKKLINIPEECSRYKAKSKKGISHRHQESDIQKACVNWFRATHRPLAKLLFSIPNGGSRHPLEAKNMKAEGIVEGVADLCLAVPNKDYHGFYIEMKTNNPKTYQKPAQKEWQELIQEQGYKYVVCRSRIEFSEEINNYLK